MKRQRSPRSRKLLSRAQVVLSIMTALLVVALGGTVTLAYISLNTSEAFQAGYVLADLASVQHELTRLHVETNRALRDRSKNLEPLILRRQTLDRHIEIALAESSNNQQVITVLNSIASLLEQYDYEVRYLSNHLVDQQYRSSAHQFDSILELLEQQLGNLYNTEELTFYQNIGAALRQQRTAQTVAVGIGGLILVFGLLLALSVGRTVSGEFEHAYELLKTEVAVRRSAEEELKQRNEYLAALHETTFALMNRLEVADLLEAIIARAAQLLGTEDGYIFLANPAHTAVEQRVGIGLYTQAVGQRFRPNQGLPGVVWATGQRQVINDYTTWRSAQPWAGPQDEGITAVVCVPLRSGQETVGVIGLAHSVDAPKSFSAADVTLLEGFAQLVSLALDNAQLFAQATERSIQIDTLYQADTELYRHLELSSVLNALVNIAVDVLRVDKSAFLIWDEACTRLIPGAARGYAVETLALVQSEAGQGLAGLAARTAQPVVVQDTTVDRRVDWHLTYPERIRSFMHVPVVVDGHVFGVFTVAYVQPRAFDAEDQRLILALAQRVAMAITNARTYQQAQQAATLEERQRLARDLHDAVTQTLFSASLIADVLPRLWQRDPDAAASRAEELGELTRGALAEMRTLLLELRPGALTESGLAELLMQLGQATRGRARVPVRVDAGSDTELPPEVKVGFYRIAQEALSNVTKHAGAQRIDVALHQSQGTTCLCIRDDGIGFDPDSVTPAHMGLRIMRERADAIGASFAVESKPGTGTTITVLWRPSAASPEPQGQE